jgi:hypothetical protein
MINKNRRKEKMKKIISCIIIATVLLIASASAATLFAGVLSYFQTTVNPAEVSFTSADIHIPSINSLDTFDTGVYSPAGTEIHIANINISNADISSDITDAEKSAFSSLLCHINISNTSRTLLNTTFNPILDEHVYISEALGGDWDVTVRYTGTTNLVSAPIPISFAVTINLTDGIPICEQWFGATYQSGEEHYPIENATMTVNEMQCATNNLGYCTLNISKYAAYTVAANHSEYNTTPAISFIACADGTDNIGYPIILQL